MQLVCKKCGYVWNTNSTAKRVSCSKCKTSITIHTPSPPPNQQQPKPQDFIPVATTQTFTNKIITEVKFPLSLWRDVRLRQRMDHAPSLGDDHIVLKVDKDGILYL